MKTKLMLLSTVIICLLVSNVCFADIVQFNNGFSYEGEVTQDDKTGGYWIDGALVEKGEVKSIEKKDFVKAQSIMSEKLAWHERFFSAVASFKKNWSKNDKSETKITSKNTSTVSQYSKPVQASSKRVRANYTGTSQNVWQSIRRNTGPGASSMKNKGAGYVTKRDRVQKSQKLKRNSAGYKLKAERQKNKSQSGLSRRNSAGYELSRQRKITDRQLSSFGNNSGSQY